MPFRVYLHNRLEKVDREIARISADLESLLIEQLDIFIIVSRHAPERLIESMDSLTDEHAWFMLERLRWPEGPVCTNCGGRETYRHRSRRIHSCRSCHQQFSATGDTLFANHKLGPKNMLLAILILQAEPSLKAIDLMRLLDVQYRTAHTLVGKVRKMRGNDPFLRIHPPDQAATH